MPIFEHGCKKCGYEWEDWFSSHREPVPDRCPKCKKKGKIKRLISMTQGKVELYGRELIQKLRSDARKISEKAKRSDKVLEDIVGPSKSNED